MSPADWYQVQSKMLDEKTQDIISKQFGGSLYRTLSTIFPETEWYPWKFAPHQRAPTAFWKEPSNQRKFFDDLAKELGIHTLDDWYQKLTAKTIQNHGGQTLLKTFNYSPTAALQSAYPEHKWEQWKFNVPSQYWKSIEHQRQYLDWLGKQLGIKELDDWYLRSAKTLQDNKGGSLLNLYNGSLASVLMAAYPEHKWIPWKFNAVPHGFWSSITNQKQFFDWLGKELEIKELDDWYQHLTAKVIQKNGGSRLLALFNSSPIAALMAAYPEHKWIPWKFGKVSQQTWKSKDNVKNFLNELSEKLSIQTLDDWYRVDIAHLKQLGADTAIVRAGGLYNLLKEQYPHHPWDPKGFRFTKKAQRWLAVTLKKMFPEEEIVEDYQHPKAFLSTKRPMQLDVYIPSKSLAFEYQGKQHYEDVGIFSPAKTYQQRDEEKRTLCAANNIKLIEVPYWWNRTQQELQEIISNASK